MRLALSDGYTVPFSTSESVTDPVTGRIVVDGLPLVSGQYRPALPEAIAEWRWKLARATSGREETAATFEHLLAHLTEWDVTLDDGARRAPLSAEFLRLVPDPVLGQLVTRVNTWAPKQRVADAGNLQAG